MNLRSIHPRFGVEVVGTDLRDINAASGYAELRDVFEQHSMLLLRGQQLDDDAHIRLAALFGVIEDRSEGADGPLPRVSMVANVDQQQRVIDEAESRVLNLKANQLWHTDSTFLPVPALVNILTAKVLPSVGGETEIASTRAAWRDMPELLKAQARTTWFRHRYAHSRQKISPQLATEPLFTRWKDQTWRAVWTNPVNGEEALYVASHICGAEGMTDSDAQAFAAQLVDFATREEYVYRHHWAVGDVLIWDERATLHRGLSWPYDQPRSLASLCVSVAESDGLGSVRPA